MKKLLLLFLHSILIVGTANQLLANNIQITSLSVGDRTAEQKLPLSFTISWDNAWRVDNGQNNWDAAWIFVKYRNHNQEYWQHASLSFGSGHSVTATQGAIGGIIESSDDTGSGQSKGVFLYSSSSISQQTVSYDVTLEWDYGFDAQGDGDTFDIHVYAIEMVYVPKGQFYLGSGSTLANYETDPFYTHDGGSLSSTTTPYLVLSEEAITVGTSSGDLYYNLDGTDTGDLQDGTIPASFPKGYESFYCMKYEITQGQYASFLNTLSSDQISNNYNDKAVWRENLIYDAGAGEYSSTTPSFAQNFLEHPYAMNYMDWSALRPMTELEFEKACRGTLLVVENEFAWGTSNINATVYGTSGSGDSEEVTNYNNASGNANYVTVNSTISGVTRVGVFASNADNTGRETAGASYYGIMDLSGNVYETVIPVSTSEGRSYDGSHGDGMLNAFGIYNQSGWPSSSSTGSIGGRGGAFNTSQNELRVSNRVNIAKDFSTLRFLLGGRGVRTAP
ncbi:SUMF1/EgtB/PvdO family nonheme iron enzyme [Flammeovirga aprica]|uniref:Formylglycine-generating enzyme family protein n=1 Tax=Flammeovirga aprica JL-4 TaxID=694437 RepID=A0A7X9XAX9_9BACT|nr:SUMF1/EgtB/PvdO family nonheme iron enzyme [Flammeovirga aprica]NME70152.1 formylglycine-generating enzyme family protein [Flammeovirga aprica JL-4]